ncbi:MAG TPA: hypothetical protein VM934_12505 [Pyrinomonadaceae bacterium]|jgi:hypothetical protein|nr:hypothetical protein [Pyrinomonadaceae bacterium]
MRTSGKRFISYFLAVAIIASVVAACGNKRSLPRSAPAVAMPVVARRSLPPLPVRPLSPRLQAVRERAMNDASQTRGLGWQGGVGMTELSGWEYGTRTKEIADVLGTDDLKGLSKLAIAGGVLPEGTDLASLAVTFTAATAGATYSPLDKQVLLLSETSNSKRGPAADRSLLTHEFVHALQDQHFDLLKMLLVRPYNFDRTEAAFALVEGDAMNVERRLESGDAWARRTLDDIWRQEDERFGAYRKEIGSLFPPLLTETFVFRYRDGARFVEAMRRSRPAVSVDDLFRRPPASSEQVLHAEKYLSNEAPREVGVNEEAFAGGGWRMAAATPLGEIGVRGLLMAGNSVADARRAAAGWGGDRAFVFEREGRAPLFVWQTAWDRREDAQEFFRAYNALERKRGGSDAGGALAPGGDAQSMWREGGTLTLVRAEGDAVLVIRGAEADVAPALAMALQR